MSGLYVIDVLCSWFKADLPGLVLWSCFCFTLGGLRGVMDTIQHDPDYVSDGWKGKWWVDSEGGVLRDPGGVFNWWYLGSRFSPAYVERFPFSSTVLVMFTDGWHFLGFCLRLAYLSSYVFLFWVDLDVSSLVVLWLVFQGIGFWVFYRRGISLLF